MLAIRVISYEPASRYRALGVALLICALLPGCGANRAHEQANNSPNTVSASETTEPRPPDPILQFVEKANDHQEGIVLDPTTGAQVKVLVGRTYYAASGRLCRPYRVLNLSESSPLTSDLACQNGAGHWQKIRPLLNLDNSRISTTPP